MDFRRNSGMFVHYVFFQDYVKGQDAKNTDFDTRINFNKKYLDNLNDTLYNHGVKLTNLEAHINTLETRIKTLEDKGGTQ